jgi:hypothetical protein
MTRVNCTPRAKASHELGAFETQGFRSFADQGGQDREGRSDLAGQSDPRVPAGLSLLREVGATECSPLVFVSSFRKSAVSS